MKIVTFISLFLCGLSYSQGNLQFNQVKIVSNTDPSQTVPAGKVWKIESVFSEGGDTYPMGASGTVYAHFSACGLASFNFQNYGRYLSINNIRYLKRNHANKIFNFMLNGLKPKCLFTTCH